MPDTVITLWVPFPFIVPLENRTLVKNPASIIESQLYYSLASEARQAYSPTT